ncbi:MAG TPA: hypothetical protein VIM11_24170 [Tepidisphaeraceae bacterium]|jgi:hypothetical protein
MPKTYWISDGVRRAKAAQLAGQSEIWARVGDSPTERKLRIDSLLSPKKVIDLRPGDERKRWESVRNGMAEEPDLFPPIDVVPGAHGTPVREVAVID